RTGAPRSASARTGASRRGIGKSLLSGAVRRTSYTPNCTTYCYVRRCITNFGKWALVVLRAGQRFRGDDVVGPDPTRRTDGEAGLGARGQLTCGLVVAAKIGGLGGGEIRLGVVSFLAIGHRQLAEAERSFVFPHHRRAQDGDRLVGVRPIIGGDQR